MLNILPEAKVGAIRIAEWIKARMDPSEAAPASNEHDSNANTPRASYVGPGKRPDLHLETRSLSSPSTTMCVNETGKQAPVTGSVVASLFAPFMERTRALSNSISDVTNVRTTLLNEAEILRRRRQDAVHGFGEVEEYLEPKTPMGDRQQVEWSESEGDSESGKEEH